ncbi:MAG: SixA phosphatase family protein [Thermoplasmata archaeon]
MDLYLVRHGPAAERDPQRWPDDEARPLTPSGIREVREAARGFVRTAGPVAHYLTSPAVRARHTAELFRAAHERAPTLDLLLELRPTGEAEEVLAALAARTVTGPVALFGHEPLLAELLGMSLATDPIRLTRFSRAGAAAIEFPRSVGAGAGRLRWLLTRKQLTALGL